MYRIAEIPSTGDLLCLLQNTQEIRRLSNRNTLSKFIFTKVKWETFSALNSGGNQVYACVMLRCQNYENLNSQYKNYVCLLNEYGVILKKILYLVDCCYDK